MSFLAPLALLASLGVGLPILAHLLSRTRVRRTDWAAMQFLDRSVRVRSRQIRLRDLALLCVRCLAIALLALALSRPFVREPGGALADLGARRAGVLIGLDASFSMGHRQGDASRFEQALDHIRALTAELHPGDPLSLVLLGEEQRVVARGLAYHPDRFEELLSTLRVSHGSLDLDSVPRTLQSLLGELEAHQKEVYLLTDLQQSDWLRRSPWLADAFAELARSAPTTLVRVPSAPDGPSPANLALTELELVSGVLREGSTARYRATVRNYGPSAVTDVRVEGRVNGLTVDVKTIPVLAPGTAEAVSLFVRFREAGAFQISATLEPDALPADDVRRAVALVREDVAVLSVEGSSARGPVGGGFLAAALGAGAGEAGQENLVLRSIPWIELPEQDLSSYDLVVLQDVPDLPAQQARALEEYVRAGHGLVWFPGDHIDAAAWNALPSAGNSPLLPAELGPPVSASDALGVGRPLDPKLPEHPICRPLRSLPEDLLGETRFRKLLQVRPNAGSSQVLALAGSNAPVLLEHALGRGQVFLFTTSADAAWSNMAVTPVFPMALQQMVTYLTAREFELAQEVGDSLSLTYVDEPDAGEAVFDTPSGAALSVPVRAHQGRSVALLEQAREAGFYQARVSLQAPGVPIAVNVDAAESDPSLLSAAETERCFAGTGVRLARTRDELTDALLRSREGRSFTFVCLLAGLGLLVLEAGMVRWMRRGSSRREAS